MSTTMSVGGGSAGSNNPASTQAASQTSVDYDAFLKLLVTQLKNQDPTEPMDSTQYLAQLASFSQVEQSVQTNAKLDQLLTSSAIEQANQMIGRTLTSSDGSTSGTVTAVRITSQGLIARLADGTEMAVGAGVTIS